MTISKKIACAITVLSLTTTAYAGNEDYSAETIAQQAQSLQQVKAQANANAVAAEQHKANAQVEKDNAKAVKKAYKAAAENQKQAYEDAAASEKDQAAAAKKASKDLDKNATEIAEDLEEMIQPELGFFSRHKTVISSIVSAVFSVGATVLIGWFANCRRIADGKTLTNTNGKITEVTTPTRP